MKAFLYLFVYSLLPPSTLCYYFSLHSIVFLMCLWIILTAGSGPTGGCPALSLGKLACPEEQLNFPLFVETVQRRILELE